MVDGLTPRAFFQYRVPMKRAPSKLRIDGSLGEWTGKHRLPNLTAIDGGREFADIYAGWSEGGLSMGLHVGNKKKMNHNERNGLKSEVLILWIDTRDARDIHRATRFCHSMRIYPHGSGPKKSLPLVRKQRVTWQPELQPPGFDIKKVQVASVIEKKSYSLELHIPGSILHGFDPAEHPSLGLYVQVMDQEHGEQFWPYPAPLPFWQDPSLWAAVEMER